MDKLFKRLATLTLRLHSINSFHTTTPALAWTKSTLPNRFLKYNTKIYPPQEIGEEPRPAVSTNLPKTLHKKKKLMIFAYSLAKARLNLELKNYWTHLNLNFYYFY